MSDQRDSKERFHSPGPWTVAEDDRPGMSYNRQVVEANAPHLTVCFMTSDGPNKANARLIAAAPDMLAALQVLLPGLVLDRRYADDDDDIDALNSRIDTVTEAIKKALGHE